ncbi:hypothetical protein KCU89_g60, partial [Aureobasidium melanogenum]
MKNLAIDVRADSEETTDAYALDICVRDYTPRKDCSECKLSFPLDIFTSRTTRRVSVIGNVEQYALTRECSNTPRKGQMPCDRGSYDPSTLTWWFAQELPVYERTILRDWLPDYSSISVLAFRSRQLHTTRRPTSRRGRFSLISRSTF